MNRFKEFIKNKKTTVVIAAAVVVLAVGGTTIYFTAGKPDASRAAVTVESKNTTTQAVKTDKKQEQTTATDIMAVTLKGADGKDVVLEGVAVTDGNGNATITVTDGSGNEVVISGKAVTGADGRKTVQDAKVISGGGIITADGSVVDVSGSEVADIAENNDGSIGTDVSVSEETKADVAVKQEEAAKEAAEEAKEEAAQQVADNSGNSGNAEASGDSDDSDNGGSGSDNSGGGSVDSGSDNISAQPTPEPETQAPTEAPTAPPTEAPAPPTQATEPATRMETKYIYYYDLDGNLYYTDSITYLVYEDGQPVEANYYTGDNLDHFPPDTPEQVIIGWKLENGEMFNWNLDIATHPGNITMIPWWI